MYDADRDHHFKALVVHAHELKNLQGPVYDTGADRAHQFQQGQNSTVQNNKMNSNTCYEMRAMLHRPQLMSIGNNRIKIEFETSLVKFC